MGEPPLQTLDSSEESTHSHRTGVVNAIHARPKPGVPELFHPVESWVGRILSWLYPSRGWAGTRSAEAQPQRRK